MRDVFLIIGCVMFSMVLVLAFAATIEIIIDHHEKMKERREWRRQQWRKYGKK